MLRILLPWAAAAVLLLAAPGGHAQFWVVEEGTHVSQSDPGFAEVIPTEDMDPAHPRPGSINWGPQGKVRFYSSWNWDNPQAGDWLCWLYDGAAQPTWWKGVFNQPSTSVHIQLKGCDGNDGWVDIFVDGVLSYSYQTLNKGQVAILGYGLTNIAHTIELKTRPSGQPGAGDVSADYIAHPADLFPHKMHFPQWPDESGWDVNATAPVTLADDWRCSETGYVEDIHFWGSWRNGVVGQIQSFRLSIHNDLPVGDPGNPFPYSIPGSEVWSMTTSDFDITGLDPPTSEGWYDPMTGLVIPNDHQAYFRYDITFIPQPFWQTLDQIYWLDVSAILADPVNTQWGWKSSSNHWNDDAVWTINPANPLGWVELYEPIAPLVVEDQFYVEVDPAGGFVGGGGSGFNGGEWYYYEETDWWNEWFWDHPYDPNRMKVVHIEFDTWRMNPGQPGYLLVALNWSTPEWWLLDYGPEWPPIPGVAGFSENLHIARAPLLELNWPPVCIGDLNCDGLVNFADINPFVLFLSNFPAWQAAYPGCNPANGDINGDGVYPSFGDINPFVALLSSGSALCPPDPGGHYQLDFIIPDYNPEWVSIDVRGYNFIIQQGILRHECRPKYEQSLDLSFVITSGPPE